MRTMLLSMVAVLAGPVACGSDASECNDVPAQPTADAGSVFEFVDCRGYIDWAAESEALTTVAPHGQRTRVYVDPSLLASLTAGNAEHPVGATAVKEIFVDDRLSGWAVSIKVEAGSGGNTWYWYEVLSVEPGTTPVADARGALACTGCHSVGSDFFRTTFPLQ